MSDRDDLTGRISAEQAQAQGLAAELMALDGSQRLARVRADSRHHTVSFIDLAIALSREAARDRTDARWWAQLAIEAAQRSTDGRARELLPLGWAVLGNHHRCASELFRAEGAFARCRELHDEIADPLDLAECYSLEASYWREMRSFRRGEKLIRAALLIAERFEAQKLRAKLLVKLGMLFVEDERWHEAAETLQDGMRLARREGLMSLALCGAHNLVEILVETGDYDWAGACLCDLESLYEEHGTERQKLQRRWMIARSALGRGHFPEAAAHLKKVRDLALAQAELQVASVAQLDLAEAQVGLGDWEQAERSAAAAATTLAACGATANALVAVEYAREGIQLRLEVRALHELLASARTQAKTAR